MFLKYKHNFLSLPPSSFSHITHNLFVILIKEFENAEEELEFLCFVKFVKKRTSSHFIACFEIFQKVMNNLVGLTARPALNGSSYNFKLLWRGIMNKRNKGRGISIQGKIKGLEACSLNNFHKERKCLTGPNGMRCQ